jgi:hypothetical protein
MSKLKRAYTPLKGVRFITAHMSLYTIFIHVKFVEPQGCGQSNTFIIKSVEQRGKLTSGLGGSFARD